jgi:mono/diheme cytochrome c family protein
MVRYCARWLLPVFLVGPLVTLWFLSQIPQSAISTIYTGIQTSGVGNFSILARALYLSLVLSGTILLFAFFGPYLNPKGFTFRIAILFMVCGLAATGTTEWMREMLRKPYVVYNYMYSNGIHKADVQDLARDGFLKRGKWAGVLAQAVSSDCDKGELVFRYQCMACHTVRGYRSMKKLLGVRDEEAITSFLHMLKEEDPKKNNYIGIMPPLAANDDELKILAKYLAALNSQEREHSSKLGALPPVEAKKSLSLK